MKCLAGHSLDTLKHIKITLAVAIRCMASRFWNFTVVHTSNGLEQERTTNLPLQDISNSQLYCLENQVLNDLTRLCRVGGMPSRRHSLAIVLTRSKFGSWPLSPSSFILNRCTVSPAISRFRAAWMEPLRPPSSPALITVRSKDNCTSCCHVTSDMYMTMYVNLLF